MQKKQFNLNISDRQKEKSELTHHLVALTSVYVAPELTSKYNIMGPLHALNQIQNTNTTVISIVPPTV